MAQSFSKKFYNSKEWKSVREYILTRDHYLCVKCGAVAEEVHHIEHLTPDNIDNINVTLNPKNLESLCRECHFNEHKGEHAKGREKQEEYPYCFDENGNLILKQ